ncbi:MAG TPA: hypothetical protein VMY43_03695 [Methanothrix sp.]|nr:hypothetical protein [Methanothrix sp.]
MTASQARTGRPASGGHKQQPGPERRRQPRPRGCPALLPGACIGSFCQKVSVRSVSPHFIIE